MTEFWISQAKHWCKICKVYTGGHKSQILKHEAGRGHIEQEGIYLKTMRERESARKKDEQSVLDQLAEIERKAAEAMGIDGSSSSSAVLAKKNAEAGRSATDKRAQERSIEVAVDAAVKKARTGDAPVGAVARALELKTMKNAPRSGTVASGPGSLAAAVAVASASGWTRHRDPGSGQFYYYNPNTGESAWTKPDDFVEPSFFAPPMEDASQAAAAAAARAAGGKKKGQKGVEAPDNAAVAEAIFQASNTNSPVVAVPEAGEGDWVVCTDPNSGNLYYFNKKTLISSWEKPAELVLDLAKPPPPPKKPPPPPKKKDEAKEKAGFAGGWEEVKPEESMFGRPDEYESTAQLIQEEEEIANLVDPEVREMKRLKEQTEKHRCAPEDMEKQEKETFQKKSNFRGKTDFKQVKKAGGIRKRVDDD